MERLSSTFTPVFKLLLPSVFTLVGGLMIALTLFSGQMDALRQTWAFATLWFMASVFGWWWLGALRHVHLDEDSLVVTDFGRSDRIPVRDIASVVQNWDNGRTVTVRFVRPTQFGMSIRFQPTVKRLFGDGPVVLRLRQLAGTSDGRPD